VSLRLPFRYGATTLTAAREALVTVRIASQGREATGQAAELLAPKWFDKSPALSNDDNVAQLLQAVGMVRRRYLDTSDALTAFGLHALHDADHMVEAARAGLNGLVAGFGSALIDKAVIAALGRLTGLSFFDLIRGNGIGLDATTAPDLAGTDLGRFLAMLEPAETILARHTIGAIDALTEDEIAPAERRKDGLPESLTAAIDRYGLRAFKIKLTGAADFDLARLCAVARVLDGKVGTYMATLDGNEQFRTPEEFADFWRRVRRHPELRRLVSALRFVEQPLARDVALACPLGALAEEVPVEIDESDDGIGAFPAAVAMGYRGVSSKSCKGVYRSLLNRARVDLLNARAPGRFFMSAEDLSAQGGLAVQQDLALATLIGCDTTERNGHHFGDGRLLDTPADYADWQDHFPGLYQPLPDRLCLRIESGRIALGSLRQTQAYG
jgi:hypothetical protein